MDADLVGRIRAHKSELLVALGGTNDEQAGSEPTLLQRSYLLGRQGVDKVASHVYHEFVGRWDLPRLESALNEVIAQHDSLRTRFTDSGRRVVEPSAITHIEITDLRHLAPAEQDAAVQQRRHERSHRVMPADRAPLIYVEASILDHGLIVLAVGHDGLAMDGISMFLFFRAWQRAYEGSSAADQLEVPAFDAYVEALERGRNTVAAERSRAYWLNRLDDLPPHPELPLSVDPSSIGTPRFTQREVRLDPTWWKALKDRADEVGVTPTVMLLSAYAETLSFWGSDRRMTINATLANRPPIHPGMTRSIGQYSDVLLVEVDVDPDQDFQQRTRTLQAQLRRDLDNRHFSGLAVLREMQHRGRSHAARMPYTFNSTLGYLDPEASGSTLSAFGSEVYCVSQTPQVWVNVFVMEQDDELIVQIDAVEELFPPGLLDAFVAGYRTMLEQLRDPATWSSSTVDLLPSDQRQARLAVNATAVALPQEMAHERFLRWALQQPDAPAVISAGWTVTYGELARRARGVAAWLRARGVGRDELIGLVMRRGPEQIVGILGVAMAGAAYLPVDAALPAQRRQYMMRDGHVRCVLTNSADAVEADAAVLRIDLASPAEDPGIQLEPLPDATPDDLVYVLYTSGTTGEPKGVMVSHRSVLNVVTDCNERFSVGPGDRFFGISAFNFDLSVYDVFGSLSAGAALVLPDYDRAADPGHWLELCRQHEVTVWNSVPAIVGMLHDQAIVDGPDALTHLRLIMMSGDRIPPALPRSIRRLLPDTALISLGGPTETTVWNILHPIEESDTDRESIPYGKPNANNRCYVLDDRGRERPDWVSGEICGAGTGLARGYWGDATRTASRFLHHEALAERIYRTGDLGRYLPGGSVAILGRTDFQIKINGNRIEAGEVETRLAEITGVKQAAVVRQDGAFGSRLIAHLAGEAELRPPEAEIRALLRQNLPVYMIPAVYYWHDNLPLTRNGKDLELTERVAPVGADVGPAGPLEQAVLDIWSAVLRTAVTNVTSSFYDLGGDSLAAARVLTRVRQELGAAIALDQFYLVDTARAMAAQIEAARSAADGRKVGQR
jgi:amino acid adenylation domain-containing protein